MPNVPISLSQRSIPKGEWRVHCPVNSCTLSHNHAGARVFLLLSDVCLKTSAQLRLALPCPIGLASSSEFTLVLVLVLSAPAMQLGHTLALLHCSPGVSSDPALTFSRGEASVKAGTSARASWTCLTGSRRRLSSRSAWERTRWWRAAACLGQFGRQLEGSGGLGGVSREAAELVKWMNSSEEENPPVLRVLELKGDLSVESGNC